MAGDFVLRTARADDFEQIAALAAVTADTGRIPVKPRYLRNPVEAFAELMPELEWVVAESEGRLIGGGQIIHGDTEVEGQAYPGAVLSSLMVHPDHRRRGVATALTEWRLARVSPERAKRYSRLLRTLLAPNSTRRGGSKSSSDAPIIAPANTPAAVPTLWNAT